MADYNYVATGGINTGGEASPIISSRWTALMVGGTILAGEAVARLTLSCIGDGGITTGGDATEEITSFRYIGDGGITSGGDATEEITAYRYVASGGITTGGDATELYGIYLSYTPSGGTILGGVSPSRIKIITEGQGTIFVEGEAFASVIYGYSQPIEWQVRTYFDVAKQFEWDVGELPLKVFQIEGCCKPNNGDDGGCEILPLDTNDELNCNQRVLQTIFASNLAGVCDFLTKTNWKWPICSIKKFSTDAADLIADGVNIPPECNTLDEVEFCQIPECFEFCLHTDRTSHGGMFVEVEYASKEQYVGTGGIKIGGTYYEIISVIGSGGITVGGEVIAYSSRHIYQGSGGITVAGEAVSKSSNFKTAGSGGMNLAGEMNVVSPYFAYTGSGGMSVSGSATQRNKIHFISTGKSAVYPSYAGVKISGFASYPILVKVSGGIHVTGAARCVIPSSHHVGSGGISIAGHSDVVSPNWHYEASGGIQMGGAVEYNFLSLAYNVDDSIPITLGGDAPTRDSSGGDFWYTAITSPITLGGSADYRISQLKYKPISSPNIIMGGSAGVTSTFLNTNMCNMGMFISLEDLEVNFSVDGADAPAITAPVTTINTSCGECNQIALNLNFKHNLEFGNVFREFLIRNGLTVPTTFTLSYSKRLDSWQGTLHYTGVSADNLSNTETWRFNIDWACTKEYADDDFASSVWKFSMLVTRKNINTGIDFDTRLLVLFPSEQICVSADRDGLDFSFQYDILRNVISTRQNLVIDVVTLYDNIGLFKSKYWKTNKFNVRISEDLFVDALDKKDISFIVPQKQPQFAI